MTDDITMEHKRFTIRWDDPTFQYKVSAPLLDPHGVGLEVVPAEEYDRLHAALEKVSNPYREAIATALAELTGLHTAELDEWEKECLQAAEDVLDCALNSATPPRFRATNEGDDR